MDIFSSKPNIKKGILDPGKYVNDPAYALKVHAYAQSTKRLCIRVLKRSVTLLASWTLFTIRSVVHCYVMNFAYNQGTAVVHCFVMNFRLQSLDRTELVWQKSCPLSTYKSWYAHACIVTTRILLLHHGLLKELSCEWMRFRSICPKSLKTYSQCHQF